jgi:ketosteroid isomerase-like protein
MIEHPNLALMKRALNAFGAGDMPVLAQVFAKNIVWHVPGKSVLAKDYQGQQEVFAFFGQLMERTNGTFRVNSLDLLANDRGGVFIDRVTAQRNGRTLDVRLLLYVVIKDGQIVEGFDHFHPEHVWDAFWV